MDRWLCAALLGYALSFSFSKPLAIEQWLVAATLVVLIAWQFQSIRRYATVIGCVLCGIGWGSGNAYLHQSAQILPANFGKTLSVEVAITGITQVRDKFWRVEGDVVQIEGAALPAKLFRTPSIRLNWYEPPADAVTPPQAGTVWRFQARLKHPQGIRNDGSFLYHRYLVSRGIHALGSIRSGHYVQGEPSYRQRLFNQLNTYREQFQQFGILLALTLGERQALSPDQWLTYQRTGLAHLIAISGLHLSLVAGGILLFSRRFSARLGRSRSRRERHNSWVAGTVLALLAAFAYAWLAGFATATLRAFAMFSVVMLHKYHALHTPPSRVLLRAAAVVVVVEPMAILQPGFWLSVGAVATILLMHWRWPIIRGRWHAIRALWRLEVVLTLALWPLTALWFGGLPVLAPLTNMVMVPVIAMWMLPLSLLALLVLSLQQDIVAVWLFRLAEWPLNLAEPTLDTIARSPWQWLPDHMSGSISWLAVLLIAWLLPWRNRWKLVASSVFIAGLLIARQLHALDTAVNFYVLDVDQGSAIVVAQGSRALLVDTGADWELGGNMAERAILPFLRHHRLTPELAFVSHTDNDHQGGAKAIRAIFPHLRWYGSGQGTPCAAGQTGIWGKVRWSTLHPREVTENVNNDDSCVLLLEVNGTRILIPGDISKRAERQLLAHAADVSADILVLAHHGSNSSSEDYFLRAVQPYIAVASRGRNNAYGMVAEPVRKRLRDMGVKLFDTAAGGQVNIALSKSGWQVVQPWAAAHRAWFDADN